MIIVSPTSLATGYKLGGHPVTAIRVDSLTADISAEGATDRETVDYVVNAAGAWAKQLGEVARVELPIAPRRGQIAVVEPSMPVPESAPLIIDLDTGSYF